MHAAGRGSTPCHPLPVGKQAWWRLSADLNEGSKVYGHMLKEVAMSSATICTALIPVCGKVNDVVIRCSLMQKASSQKLAFCCVDIRGAGFMRRVWKVQVPTGDITRCCTQLSPGGSWQAAS